MLVAHLCRTARGCHSGRGRIVDYASFSLVLMQASVNMTPMILMVVVIKLSLVYTAGFLNFTALEGLTRLWSDVGLVQLVGTWLVLGRGWCGIHYFASYAVLRAFISGALAVGLVTLE